MTDAYQRVTVGHTSGGTPIVYNRRTLAALDTAANLLVRGWTHTDLTHFQGSYNKGTTQSAGTHDGGGATDCWTWSFTGPELQGALRRAGFAAWYRPPLPGVWGAHVHAELIGDADMSPEGRGQVAQYYAHTDGLAGHGPDNSWRPDPIPVFRYHQEDTLSASEVADIKAKIEDSEARIIEVVNARAKAGRTQLAGQVARALKAIDALPDGATKAEVKSLIQNIEATIHIVVNDDPEPTP